VKLNGEMVYLWRAVDHEGEILESYVTRTRGKAAALRFMKKALRRHGSPETITTDGLRSYNAALDELGCPEKQEVVAGLTTGSRTHTCHSGVAVARGLRRAGDGESCACRRLVAIRLTALCPN